MPRGRRSTSRRRSPTCSRPTPIGRRRTRRGGCPASEPAVENSRRPLASPPDRRPKLLRSPRFGTFLRPGKRGRLADEPRTRHPVRTAGQPHRLRLADAAQRFALLTSACERFSCVRPATAATARSASPGGLNTAINFRLSASRNATTCCAGVLPASAFQFGLAYAIPKRPAGQWPGSIVPLTPLLRSGWGAQQLNCLVVMLLFQWPAVAVAS